MTTNWTPPSWCKPCDPAPASIVATATWPDDADEVRTLIEEYVEWLAGEAGVHPADAQPGFIDELADLEQWYTPPHGRMILARSHGQIVGTAGVHMLSPDDAELKRVYVRPEARGQDLGRRLTDAAIREARRLGASRLLLETDPVIMPLAYRIYLERGFRPTQPYSGLDYEGAVAMERSLGLFPDLRSHGTPHYDAVNDGSAYQHDHGPRRASASHYIRRSRSGPSDAAGGELALA